MNIITFLAFFSGIGVVIGAMLMGQQWQIFVDTPSMLIVIGGTLAATLIRYSLSDSYLAWLYAFRALRAPKVSHQLVKLIDQAAELAHLRRRGGILSLEKKEIEHPFFARGIQLMVDGYKPEILSRILREQRNQFIEQAETSSGVFKAVGDVAPAFGMIGTLVGLIQMLANLSDPGSIGPAMSVALITTLYGALIAHLFALPLADKIASWSEGEAIRMQLILDAIEGINAESHPTHLQEQLSVYLRNDRAIKRKIPTEPDDDAQV